jgi:tetratricopeptide (TPR) repeat protein
MKSQFILFSFSLFLVIGCKQIEEKKTLNISDIPSVMCAPITTDKEWYNSDNVAPLFDGLDVLDFPISTNNELVQRYFNQGLVLAFGFNHAEAARSFYYATKLEPTCAMAHWGYAFVLGPNYNAGMESDNYQRAFDAVQKAVSLAKTNTNQKEKLLIDALSKRYVKEPIDDRSSLDIAFSKAMKYVYTKFPQDADIATLYVESLMNLHPWDLYTHAGDPKEWTPEILVVFQQIFALNPKHPGANHFYIHAVEASSNPELGLSSAQLYDEGLVPGAGHLIHMPAHIYIRTGDYHKGTLSNIRAIEADSSYLSACHAQGAYPLTLYPHNYHFMAATATLEGNSAYGIMAAEKVSAHSNRQLMKEPGWGTIQHYYTIPYYVNVKFGKWHEILKMENKDVALKYPDAVRHYARGMAFNALKQIDNAKIELDSLRLFENDESLKEVTIWDFNNTHQLLQIARRVLEGEIMASEGNYTQSIVFLNEAIEMEDALAYQEPPDWFFSVRHHLGAVQIEAGYYRDAIITFEKDLIKLPKNGWALHGLKLAYSKLSNNTKVAEIEIQLKDIWATADVDLSNSRIK